MEITVIFQEEDFKALLLFLAYTSLEKSGGVDLYGAYQTLDEVAKRLDIDCGGRSDMDYVHFQAQENDQLANSDNRNSVGYCFCGDS